MNKAITDGILFMPPAFEGGLSVWSKQHGTPGSDTYANDPGAAIVPSDADFGGCLELIKGSSVQRLRYMGETPILPGCYLRITARVKAVSGNLPAVRIAGWAGDGGDNHVAGLTETGPSVALTSYGEVVEVSAIVGTGARPGVDMVWGSAPVYGHFGLDLTGPNGGILRIDDIVIEDVTSVFLRSMLAFVDVRDFGAKGDGVTDDLAAFEAADSAANGRTVMVPEGTFYLGGSMTFDSRVSFEGHVTMDAGSILSLTRNFDLPSYIDALGDEQTAFAKAFQALLNNGEHESLDMGGRRIGLARPMDMQAAVDNKSFYATRRVIRNGQIEALDSPHWTSGQWTGTATYSASNALKLTNVQNIANIEVGSLITGNGVGREVYVRAKNVGAQEITLSSPLYDAEGTQAYTYTRFRYLLDFSGFSDFDKFVLSDIEFQCAGRASGILLAPSGTIFHLRDCFISRPKDRGLSSHGDGCQGMLIDRCQFLSNEEPTPAADRTSIAMNVNANDVKIRDNRIVKFRHFAVIAGGQSIITGNHFFQGDGITGAPRTAGLVLTNVNSRTSFIQNYVDNCYIDWTNEHDASPAFTGGFSFSQMTISDNIFLCGHVAPWFAFFVITPYGAGQFLNGITVTSNVFRAVGVQLDRIETIDTSFADIDRSRSTNIVFADNMFNNVSTQATNPRILKHVQNSPAATWTVPCNPGLPFDGHARNVTAMVPLGAVNTAGSSKHYGMPWTLVEQGPQKDRVTLNWAEPVKGTMTLTVRMDNPL